MMKSRRVSEELEFLRSVIDTNIFASGLINRTALFISHFNFRHFLAKVKSTGLTNPNVKFIFEN